MTHLCVETASPTARLALEAQLPTVLFVSLASSLSLPPMCVSTAAPLHTSPTQRLGLVISAAPRALPALPQPPTVRSARLSTTLHQAHSLGPALSAMQPVMSAQAQATQPVKLARLVTIR